ncbi:hypothetical protein GCM10011610_32920 [Nocardia rhizosphaerihabitans]|uniref:Uncharacterized protein n=1 Tax=Nocardia rhizosphaerihabitans TaxID=1691570 RepID=A0ABQ2KIB8_9NOCA|nr:hypothetical protein GCM10011610_32920 [Nocardia rhizosphaerihabitans]
MAPLVLGAVEESAQGEPFGIAAADIVDQDVDPAEFLERGVDDRCRALAGAEIGGNGGGRGLFEFRGDGAGGAEDADTCRGEGFGDGETDAARGAGDDGGLAGEFEIHGNTFLEL